MKELVFSASLFLLLTISSVSIFAQNAECSDVLFLYSRASGQDPSSDDRIFNKQSEGSTYYETLRSSLDEQITIRKESLNYPAFGAQPNIFLAEFNTGKYWESKNIGMDMLSNRVAYETTRCPYQQIVLAGFSQGAHVTGDSLDHITNGQSSNVTFVSMFGDPRFNPDSWAAKGTFQTKLVGRSGGLLEQRSEFPETYRGKLESWCLHDDGFCENKILRTQNKGGMTTNHDNYETDGIVKSSATRASAKILEKYNELKGVSLELRRLPTSGTKYDIVFVFDQAQTMAQAASAIKSKMDNFLSNVLVTGYDTRLGVVRLDEIRQGVGGVYKPIVETVAPIGGVDAFRTSWTFGVTGGTKFPDADKTSPILSGIMHVAETAQWRGNSQKHIIVLTDQPMKTTEFFSGKSTDEVATYVGSKDISVHVVATQWDNRTAPTSSELESAYKAPVTDKMSGHYTIGHQFLADKNINDALLAINDIPSIDSTGLIESWPGKPITLSINASSPAGRDIVNYDWDLDHDGQYERSTTTPSIKYTYDQQYAGIVKVRVTDAIGLQNTSSIPVNITENNRSIYRPRLPIDVIIDIDRKGPKLRWVLPEKTDDKELAWFDNLSRSIKELFIPGVYAETEDPHEIKVVTFHDKNGGLLGLLETSGESVELPEGFTQQYDVFGVSFHTDVGSSEITNVQVPEEPAIPDPIAEPDPATKDPLPIQTPNNPENLESPVDQNAQKSDVEAQQQITKSDTQDLAIGKSSNPTSESREAEISQQVDSADSSKDPQTSKYTKGKVLAQKDRGLLLPWLYIISLSLPITAIIIYKLKTSN